MIDLYSLWTFILNFADIVYRKHISFSKPFV